MESLLPIAAYYKFHRPLLIILFDCIYTCQFLYVTGIVIDYLALNRNSHFREWLRFV